MQAISTLKTRPRPTMAFVAGLLVLLASVAAVLLVTDSGGSTDGSAVPEVRADGPSGFGSYAEEPLTARFGAGATAGASDPLVVRFGSTDDGGPEPQSLEEPLVVRFGP